MILKDVKELILFCKQNGIKYIEVGDVKIVFPDDNLMPGAPAKGSLDLIGGTGKPAGLFDHIDGREPDFTPLPEEED